jgi:hypothetical protein
LLNGPGCSQRIITFRRTRVKQKVGGLCSHGSRLCRGPMPPQDRSSHLGALTFIKSKMSDRLCRHWNSLLVGFSSLKALHERFFRKAHYMNLQRTNINKLCAFNINKFCWYLHDECLDEPDNIYGHLLVGLHQRTHIFNLVVSDTHWVVLQP